MDAIIKGLNDRRAEILETLDGLPNAAMDTPAWTDRISELVAIKRRLVALGAE